MKLLKVSNNKFYKELEIFLYKRSELDNEKIKDLVKLIINEVKINGDDAICNYARKFAQTVMEKRNS